MRIFTILRSIRNNLRTNPIQDNLERQEFRILLNGDFATVEYKKIGNKSYDLIHAHIPDTYHGQGLGAILAERVFDHIITNNSKMKISCEFLQRFLKSNNDRYKMHVLE
ncbi:hypothetical protein NQ317_010064 [Molorchus minor]|uniref:Protein NATD1 n=1 Tax=Molorchus minor TaxID=1323400 RepID=A0ABQ9JK89_9CUCU|nr:hypothetical protein NQ317_010064 [Molorchus minor]